MYSQSPRTYENISKLIERVRELGGDGANEISELLESVNDFLVSTKPEKQIDRDRNISEGRIKKVLDTIAAALDKFAKLQRKDPRSVQMLSFADETVKDRLKLMSGKGDKIYTYFSEHDDHPLRKHFPDLVTPKYK